MYILPSRDRRQTQADKPGNYPEMGLSDVRKAYRKQKAIRDDATQGDPLAVLAKPRRETVKQTEADKLSAYTVADLVKHYQTEHIEKARAVKGQRESCTANETRCATVALMMVGAFAIPAAIVSVFTYFKSKGKAAFIHSFSTPTISGEVQYAKKLGRNQFCVRGFFTMYYNRDNYL